MSFFQIIQILFGEKKNSTNPNVINFFFQIIQVLLKKNIFLFK